MTDLTRDHEDLYFLNGTGLCAWRLGDHRVAAAVFKRMPG